MATYVHHVPGRLRLRFPRLKRNPALGEALSAAFAGVAGVRSVQVNVLTGSLLVVYDPALASFESLREVIPPGLGTCPTAVREQASSRLASQLTESLGERLVNAAVEQAVAHSARVLLGALL